MPIILANKKKGDENLGQIGKAAAYYSMLNDLQVVYHSGS